MNAQRAEQLEQDFDHMDRILDFVYKMALQRKKTNESELKTIEMLRAQIRDE